MGGTGCEVKGLALVGGAMLSKSFISKSLIINLYAGQEATVRTEHVTDRF